MKRTPPNGAPSSLYELRHQAPPVPSGRPRMPWLPPEEFARAVQARREARAAARRPHPGRVLAAVTRADGSELRVTLHTYNGHPFVRIAAWHDGWPLRGKGTTVRVRELGAVVAGLGAALAETSAEGR